MAGGYSKHSTSHLDRGEGSVCLSSRRPLLIYPILSDGIDLAAVAVSPEAKMNTTWVESAAIRMQALARGWPLRRWFFECSIGVAKELPLPVVWELATFVIAYEAATYGIAAMHAICNMLTGRINLAMMVVAEEAKTKVARVESAAIRIQAPARGVVTNV